MAERKEKIEKSTNIKDKVQWHPAFVAALKLEMREYAEHLHFESEPVLNKAPIKADLLLVKKDEVEMKEYDWGLFFKKHNLFEYKGEGDSLNWKMFSKGLAYTYLYTSQEKIGDGRKWEDITLTFMRRAKPVKLLEELRKLDFSVEKKEKGVYHIGGKTAFDIQIIVLKEVLFDRHPWLAALTRNLQSEQLKKLFRQEMELTEEEDKENAAAVMEVVTKVNSTVLGQIKGDVNMGEAMMQLMKPEIDALIAKKEAEMAKKMEAEMAEKDAEIKRLKEQIESLKKQVV